MLIWNVIIWKELICHEEPSMWIIPHQILTYHFLLIRFRLVGMPYYHFVRWGLHTSHFFSIIWNMFCCCSVQSFSNWANLLLKLFNSIDIKEIFSSVLFNHMVCSCSVFETSLVWCPLIITFLLYLLLTCALCFFIRNYFLPTLTI